MIEMEYMDRLDEPIVLAHGQYKYYKYWILSFGSHPTAYVEVPRGHPLWFKDYIVCSRFIRVHGGLTYSGIFFLDLIVVNGPLVGIMPMPMTVTTHHYSVKSTANNIKQEKFSLT